LNDIERKYIILRHEYLKYMEENSL